MKKLFPLLLLAGLAWGQGSTPNCQFSVAFTSATPQLTPFSNKATTTGGGPACINWVMSYWTNGASGVSVLLQGAPDVAGSPGTWVTLTAISSSANPSTTTTRGEILACCDAYPWIRVNPTTFTGTSQSMTVRVYGTLGLTAGLSGGGGGSGITQLTQDVLAGPGSGSVAATVVGIDTVPLCSGYTPTNGQFIQYTTGGSPNPCYTAATGGSGSGNPASIVPYTPSASVTLTCPSSTAGTVTEFDPGVTALAANMVVSFSTCTAGQVITLRVIQAASGGPYSVAGLPTGSPAMLTFPSSTTVYQFQAATSSTVTFVNVAGISGASSLGSGANGISRTVTAGAAGVTAGLLAAKDASNPTLYQTAGSGGCGSGVAAYSATSGNTFELYTVPGTVLSMIADGTITAGHILTGGSSTPGRVADTGQTARTAVALGTCIVGVALQSQTVGNTLLVQYDGTGVYGSLQNFPVVVGTVGAPGIGLTAGQGATAFFTAPTGGGTYRLTVTLYITATGLGTSVTVTGGKNGAGTMCSGAPVTPINLSSSTSVSNCSFTTFLAAGAQLFWGATFSAISSAPTYNVYGIAEQLQ